MIDFLTIPSPCYVLDERLLDANLAVIDRVRRESGAEVIVALKACAMWSIFPELARHSDGATASSAAEARLVFEEFGRPPCHTHAVLYGSQHRRDTALQRPHRVQFRGAVRAFRTAGAHPRHFVRTEDRPGVFARRDGPSARPLRSRFAAWASRPASCAELPAGIEGLHFHVLCESRPAHLRLALEAVERRFGRLLDRVAWLNMGGGHLMTHAEYDCDELIALLREFRSRHPHLRLILEPGSAFTWRTGYLVSTVEDIVTNGGVHTAMLDVSFACHMPDCLEMPYKPAIVGAHDPAEGETRWRMGGTSCLAGDYCGDWAFDRAPQVG